MRFATQGLPPAGQSNGLADVACADLHDRWAGQDSERVMV